MWQMMFYFVRVRVLLLLRHSHLFEYMFGQVGVVETNCGKMDRIVMKMSIRACSIISVLRERRMPTDYISCIFLTTEAQHVNFSPSR